MNIKKFISFIFAEEEDFSLENRLFLASIIIGILTSIVGSIMNFVLATSITASIIPLILTTNLGFLYYLVRFKKIMKPLIFPIIIIAMVGVSIIWIFNGGIDGSNSITLLVILILALIIVSDKNKYYVLSLHITLISLLYFLQLLRPDLIIGFVSEQERWIDGYITILYSSVFIFLIVKFLHKNYILERHRAKESELRYRTLVETANEGIVVVQGTQIKFFNPMILKITGYTEEELYQIPFIEFIHPDDRQIMMNNYIKRMTGEYVENRYNFRILTKYRGVVWLEMSGVKIVWEGEPATLNFMYDISETKQKEHLIKLNEENLKSLINNRDESIWSIDSNYIFLVLNDFFINEYKSVFNIDLKVGMNAMELLSSELVDLWRPKYDNALAGNRVSFEFNIKRGNGNQFYQVYLNPIVVDGKVCGASGMSVNITDQKNSEKALIESELQFKSLFENAADAIFIADKNTGIILNANQAASNLLKMSLDEIIGLHQTQLHPLELENSSKDAFKIHNDEIVNSKSTTVVESFVICSDNSIIPVEILASDVHYKGIDAIMGTFRNITDRKKTEIEIQNKNQELTNLNNTKDKFFSIIAHDLKNPISSFKQISEMLSDDYHDFSEEELKDYLIELKRSSIAVYELLENLLTWSRTQSGRIIFSPQVFDLSYLVNSIVNLHKLASLNKKIILINKFIEQLNINADANLINTVIRNLISNAIKFTPVGGSVEIGAVNKPSEGLEPSEGYTLIYVKDSGVGMPPELLNKLFKIEENVTNKGTSGESGTGLGLILCKEFVEKHGGKIWVESQVGKGSTFWFSLPKDMV